MNKLDPIALTKELVAINSVNPFKSVTFQGKEYGVGNEDEINSYLHTLLSELGFHVEKQIYQAEIKDEAGKIIVPERSNIFASKGNLEKSILFLAHTDTVDIKEGWKCDPLVGYEESIEGEQRFYALGSNDMKSGIAAILSAVQDVTPKFFNIKIALVSDEEYWSYGAHALTQDKFLNDVKLCIVPELMEYASPDRSQWLGLGRLGRVEYQVDILGKSCHGADAFTTTEGINAVHESIKIQNELLKFIENSKDTFTKGEIRVTNSAYISQQIGGKAILSVPDRAQFIVDRSLIPTESVEGEFEKLNEYLDKLKKDGIINPLVKVSCTLRTRPTPPCNPYFIEEDSSLTQWIISLISREGETVRCGIGRSVADENRIAALGIPTYIIPPRGGDSHTNSEWVILDSIVTISNTFKSICESKDLIAILD